MQLDKMAEMVYFKVHMEYGEGAKAEVRRFGIEKVRATSFEIVCNKVRDIFPSLRNSEHDIGWKDDEDDFVIISSDEELLIALSMQSDATKKLYVVASRPESEMATPDIEIVAGFLETPNLSSHCEEGPQHHPSVVCDGCENPVVGFRYKCMSCPDYDLCVQCEWAGMHSQHVMLRIPKPINMAALRHHHGSRLVHYLLKSLKKENAGPTPKNYEQKFMKNLSNDLGSARKSKERKDKKEHCKRQKGMKGDWMEKIASCLEDVAKGMAENNGVEKPQGTDANVGTEKDTTKSKATDYKPPHYGDANFEDIQKLYLNSIQNMASKILEPLCSVGLEVFKQYGSQPTSHSDSQAGPSSQPASDAPAEASDESAKETPEVLLKEAAETQQMNTSESDAEKASSIASEEQVSDKASSTTSERVEEWTLINDPTDRELQQVPATGATNLSHDENTSSATVTGVGPSAPASNDLNNSSAPPVQAGPYHDLMQQVMEDLNNKKSAEFPQLNDGVNNGGVPRCIPLGFESAVLSPTVAPASSHVGRPASLAPNAPLARHNMPAATISNTGRAPPPPQKHAKPHIESALQHMLAMGFYNEGGWLTQLLESKDGNISAVLDLLSPAKKSM